MPITTTSAGEPKLATKSTAASPNLDGPERFDWDGFIHKATYGTVAGLSAPSCYRPPTMTSPDGRWLYLASQDIDVGVDDVEMLRCLLNILIVGLRAEIARFSWSCRRAARYETDYLAVWERLYILDALPDGYRAPEYYLELAWRGRKPVISYTRDVAAEDIA